MDPQYPEVPGDEFLTPTKFLDSGHPEVIAFAERHSRWASTDREKAIRLFYAVRDSIRYNGLGMNFDPEYYTASGVLRRKQAYCIPKAILLAAAARAVGIPSSLGFGDVINHIAPQRILDMMGTDVFYWHGNTNLFIEGKWVKATPAFNIEMCHRFKVLPLEFDGVNDSLLHPYDAENNRHMEYVGDHGAHIDFPAELVFSEMKRHYPKFAKMVEDGQILSAAKTGDAIPA